MRNEVIYGGFIRQEKDEKPVEFTHRLDEKQGWISSCFEPSEFNLVLYIGKCRIDGDMFAATDTTEDSTDNIMIFKGHLNSGKY